MMASLRDGRRYVPMLLIGGMTVFAAISVAVIGVVSHRADAACGAPIPTVGHAGAFPTAANSGVPKGMHLKPSGSVYVTESDQVIDGLDIHGTVTINASCVTLERSRVTGGGYAVVKVAPGLTNVRIIDVTLNGTGRDGESGSAGVQGPMTVIGSDISGVENGVTPGDGSVIEDNYIHGLLAPGSPHYDGIQIDGGLHISVLGNTIDMHELGSVSTVMVDNYFGPATDIQVRGNRLIGAGFTVYSDAHFSGGPITDVAFVDNRMTRGYYGYVTITKSSPTWTGNVDDATGAPIGDS